jgi:hypothetical protein
LSTPARPTPGQVAAAANGASAARGVRQLPLTFERLPAGGIRISSPYMPGWSTVARGGPYAIAAAIDAAWTEAQVAAYARWQGRMYDHDDPTSRGWPDPADPPERPRQPASWARSGPRRERPNRPDVHPPDAWRPLPDGGFLSPSGRTYGPQTECARRVAARREAAGLPLPP